MINKADLRRYLADRHAFRREQLTLPGGTPFGEVEEPWQTEHVFGPLDERDGDGWRYRLLYFELHRGAAKTLALAMEACTVAILDEDVRVYLVAADQDQARIAFDMLTGLIRRNPALEPSFRILRNEIEVPATGTVIKVMASDVPTSFGLGGLSRGFLVLADELWAWPGRDLFDAFFTAAPKSPDWRIIIGSNAGFDRKSVAWKVRELCREPVDPRFYLYAPKGVVSSWIRPEEVEAQRRSLPPHVFRRLWENEWTEGEGEFVTAEEYDACADGDRPLAPTKEPALAVGVDIGIRHDSTAVVACYPEDGRIRLARHRIWTPTRRQRVDLGAVEAWLLRLAGEYRVWAVWADPHQFEGSMARLRKAGLAVKSFEQTPTNQTAAGQALFDAITEGRLAAYPAADLREQVLNAVALETRQGWRLAKEKASRRIDGCVALSMAVLGATKIPTQYQTRARPVARPSGPPLDPDGWSEGGKSRWSVADLVPAQRRRHW